MDDILYDEYVPNLSIDAVLDINRASEFAVFHSKKLKLVDMRGEIVIETQTERWRDSGIYRKDNVYAYSREPFEKKP